MVIKAPRNPGTSDIIQFSDVIRAGGSTIQGIRQLTPGETEIAKLEKYIVLADKGISLLGRAEPIISGILQKYGQKSTEAPMQNEITRLAPGEGGSINKDITGEPSRNPVSTPAAPAPAVSIDPLQIAGALRMIDGQAPGITAVQIADLIEKNPGAVGRIMETALKTGMVPK